MRNILSCALKLALIAAIGTPAFAQMGGGGSNGGPCTEPGLTFNMHRMWGIAKNNTPKPPWPEWDGACSYTMDVMTDFHEETAPFGKDDTWTYRIKINNFLEEYHDVMGTTELYQMNVDFDYEQEATYVKTNDKIKYTEGEFKEIYTNYPGGIKSGLQTDTSQMLTVAEANSADPWDSNGQDRTYTELYTIAVSIPGPTLYLESHTNDWETFQNYEGGEATEYEMMFQSFRTLDQVTRVMADGHFSRHFRKDFYDPDEIGGLNNKIEKKLGNIGPHRISQIPALPTKVETIVNYRSNGRRSSATVEVDDGTSAILSVEWADIPDAPPINITIDGAAKTEAEGNAWLAGTAVPAAVAYNAGGCPFLAGTVQALGTE